MQTKGIVMTAISNDVRALVVSVDSTQFETSEQRAKTLAHVRKMTKFIDAPVLVIDRSNTSIEALNDEQLAKLGLTRLDKEDV